MVASSGKSEWLISPLGESEWLVASSGESEWLISSLGESDQLIAFSGESEWSIAFSGESVPFSGEPEWLVVMYAGLSSAARAGSSAQQDHSLPCCPGLLAAAHAQPEWKQVSTNLVCYAVHSFLGTHPLLTGGSNLYANIVRTSIP